MELQRFRDIAALVAEGDAKMQAQGVLHIKIEGQNFTACAGQRPGQICRQGRFSYAAFR